MPKIVVLRVRYSPNHSPNTSFRLKDQKTVIGRDESSDIVLDAPAVSRRHACIILERPNIYIEDVGSTNGTFINDQRLAEGERYRLRRDDVISLGSEVQLSIDLEDDDDIAPNKTIVETIKRRDIEDIYPPTKAPSTARAIEAVRPQAINQLTNTTRQRLGCPYCFRTLDPNDERRDFRQFVRSADGQTFHAICWDSHKESLSQPSEIKPVQIKAPDPLPVVDREPIVLYSGPSNAISDTPLGISVGTLFIQGHPEAHNPNNVFALQNNSDQPITIHRNLGPRWLYLDFGRYDDAPSPTITLQPNDYVQVKVYADQARPPYSQQDVYLLENDYIQVMTRTFSAALGLSLLILLAAAVVGFLMALSVLLGNSWHGPAIISIVGGLMAGWAFFTSPSRLVWHGLRLVLGLRPILGRISLFDRPIKRLLRFFWIDLLADGGVIRLMRSTALRAWLALSIGTGCAILLGMVWAFASQPQNFGLRHLLSIVAAIVIAWSTLSWLKDYGFDALAWATNYARKQATLAREASH
jgi:hypothetical protein